MEKYGHELVYIVIETWDGAELLNIYRNFEHAKEDVKALVARNASEYGVGEDGESLQEWLDEIDQLQDPVSEGRLYVQYGDVARIEVRPIH